MKIDKAAGVIHSYEKQEKVFSLGDILHNFNGTGYRVMEKYTEKNMLLMNLSSGDFVVALDTEYFARYPKNGERTKENAEYGIEWGHGVYLSNIPSKIDFLALKTEYCEPYQQKGREFSIEIREMLSRIEKIPAENLGEALDLAMEMYKSEKVVLDYRDCRDVSCIPVEGKSR